MGPSARNVWSFKTDGVSKQFLVAVVSQERLHCTLFWGDQRGKGKLFNCLVKKVDEMCSFVSNNSQVIIYLLLVTKKDLKSLWACVQIKSIYTKK